MLTKNTKTNNHLKQNLASMHTLYRVIILIIVIMRITFLKTYIIAVEEDILKIEKNIKKNTSLRKKREIPNKTKRETKEKSFSF